MNRVRQLAPARRWASSASALSSSSSSSPARNVIDELEARGFIQAVTSPNLRTHLESPSCVYVGVDPSASSLHVGNLLPLLGLLHFRARGHHALALIGGATGSIGDPSGRSTERNALSPAELATNVAGITAQVERFFSRGIEYAGRRGYDVASEPVGRPAASATAVLGARGIDVLNNHDWFRDVSFLDFLRDVGKYARVNVMMARDSVKSRLESDAGISFTEFSYQLLQAYDFATLYRTHGCRVQLGGSDQWGNIVAGIDLIRRLNVPDGAEEAADPAFGLTIPLLTTASGEKFGKSAGNAVWLDEARTSVSDFYQFFHRANDADVEKYLSVLTLVPPAHIAEVMAEHAKAPKLRAAQTLLAEEVTELVHSRAAVSRAQTVQKVLYGSDLASLRAADVLAAMEGDPRLVRVSAADVADVPVSKLAATYGLAKSRGDANRVIEGKGLRVNGAVVADPRATIAHADLIDGHLALLARGSRDIVVLYID
ncbi:tyrosyl-tRNA synthetase [Vanrija albida]|uniref:Tyrosine--tRNA ligase n=1 Tax=Vanrija albida TaxID=181172 RepID=A0ABR3PXU9_9TREE